MFNTQKRYFKKKLDGVQKMIWDLEFKRAKNRYTREQIRIEYDNSRARLEVLKTTIKAESEKGKLKDTNIDEFKRLEDEQVILERDIDRKQKQMGDLDIEVFGSKPTAELPEGHQGVNQTIEALRELQVVTKEYIKQL